MRKILVAALACGLMISTATFADSILGKIIYEGGVWKLEPHDLSAKPECAKKHPGGKVENQTLVLGAGKALANVFVQIKNPPTGDHEASSEAAVVDIDGCTYRPRVIAVMVGQPLKFSNSDPILHNVHGLPKENDEFNIGMPPSIKESDRTFNKPEPVFRVKCDVHPWMSSYVAVMTHPYFAVTDLDGTFEIENVPDGTYEIEAWHEKLPAMTGSATVSGGDATVDFSFKPPAKRAGDPTESKLPGDPSNQSKPVPDVGVSPVSAASKTGAGARAMADSATVGEKQASAGGGNLIDSSDKGESGATSNRPDEETSFVSGGGLSVIPNWVPIYPNASDTQSTLHSTTANGVTGFLTSRTADDVRKVVEHFKQLFRDQGYEVGSESITEIGEGAFGTINGELAEQGRSINVVIVENAGETEVTINYNEKKQ